MILRILLVALAMITVPLSLAPARACAAPGPEEAVTQMGHISIRAIGKGAPLFLIPGLSSPRAVWDGVAPELARMHRVYLVQVNGFGGDEPRDNLTSGVLDGIVAELHAYIRETKAHGAAVVGHSMGGLVGMMLASRHPDDVGRLMVVDAFAFIGPVFGAADVAALTPQAARYRDGLTGNWERAREAARTPLAADPGGNMSITPAGRIRVANWSMQADLRVVAQAMYEVMTTDLRPAIGAIAARPFTVLYAAGMGEAEAKAIWDPAYAGSPARLVAVPGSYHFIMLDRPDAFRAELIRFLGE